MEPLSVCLVVVGDEILKGQVVDTNTSRLAKSLAGIGLQLRRVIVVPDMVDEIAAEVRSASSRYSVVFTAGGVGPTHDDLTYAGIASGLGLELKENEDLLKLYGRAFPGERAALRLATVPCPCDLVFLKSPDGGGSNQDFAVIKAANVYVLPGSPKYFGPAVDAIVPRLQAGNPRYSDSIEVPLDEFTIVDILDEFAKRWEGRVAIGSYPQDGATDLTKITLEGTPDDVIRLKSDLQAALVARQASTAQRFTLSRAKGVLRTGERRTHVKSALQILQQCYEQYSDKEIFLNFNGGKDCTAVLHLAATVAKFKGLSSISCLYVTHDPFPEVEEFVSSAEAFYGLEIIRSHEPMKVAVKTLLNDRKDLKIGLMGMRAGDPGSKNLQPFAPTDNGWPEMTRVNPILDWSYSQVWEFLREHEIPYCSLYDKGYTSLGSRATTKPNPLLADPNSPDGYLPAYTLTDSTVERHGRG